MLKSLSLKSGGSEGCPGQDLDLQTACVILLRLCPQDAANVAQKFISDARAGFIYVLRQSGQPKNSGAGEFMMTGLPSSM
jgi:hypothetical protein